MKNLIATVALVSLSTTLFAQKYGPTPADSLKCLESLSLLQTFVKQKSYDEALPYWEQAFTICPAASKNIYIYGVQIFRKRVKSAADDAQRKERVDSMMMIYDTRITHFNQECFVLGRKGVDMQRYQKEDIEAVYNTLKRSIDGCANKSEAPIISSYYKALYDMFKAEKVEKELLLTEYVRLQKIIDFNVEKNCGKGDAKKDKRCKQYQAAGEKMNDVFFRIAECPEIEDIISKMMTAASADMEVCKSALKILTKKGCDGEDIYREVAECVHVDSPTHESAYALGIIYTKKKDFSGALKYMEEAINLCDGCADVEKYFEKAGQVASAMGAVGKVRGFANQLLKVNPNNGEAYILLGDAVVAKYGKCGDEVQDWGVNWLAYDYYSKAKAVDSGVVAKAQKRMGGCRTRFPEKSKAFFHELKAGESISVTCVGGETTVRTK